MATSTRRPAAERRDEIGRAILQIIGERGIKSLTTSALAKEIGLTSGALFRHFATLDEMLDESVRIALAMIDETYPDESETAIDRLLTLARNRIALLRSEPGVAWLLRSEQAHLILPESAATRLRVGVDRSKKYLLTVMREGAEQGSIRDDIAVEVLLIPVMGTIQALCGLPGVHKLAGRGRGVDANRVLSALKMLLAPVAGATDTQSEPPGRS